MLTSALDSWPAQVEVDDLTHRIAIPICRSMQESVVGLSADPSPVRLDAGLVGLARLGRGLALRRLVSFCPVETEGTSLDLCDDGGPFLGGLRSKHVAGGESVLEPVLSLGILDRVVLRTGWAPGGRRHLRPMTLLASTSRLAGAIHLLMA